MVQGQGSKGVGISTPSRTAYKRQQLAPAWFTKVEQTIGKRRRRKESTGLKDQISSTAQPLRFLGQLRKTPGSVRFVPGETGDAGRTEERVYMRNYLYSR